MKKSKKRFFIFLSFLFLVIILTTLYAANDISILDEGMWTFDNPPRKILKEKYSFEINDEWLDHIRLSSVRFDDGGSGSFVSSNGLVMTNHHVAIGQLQKMSTSEHDYVTTGYYAKSPSEEIPSPDLTLNVLMSIDNVTARVKAAAQTDMSREEALAAMKAEMAKIEQESFDATHLRSEVVTLYHGGEYWLYRYKKYTDVRLVFAPERQAAYFGGDYDNFTYPRYDLDIAFFRVYEDGKHVNSTNYFKFNPIGASDGELVFVSGHPGSTDRLLAFSQLLFERDYYYPIRLAIIDRRIQALRDYSKVGKEQERRALVQIFSLENAKKAFTGEYYGLKNQELMLKKYAEENTLKNQIAQNPEWQHLYGDAWNTIETVVQKQTSFVKKQFFRRFYGSKLTSFAINLVFYAIESKKPDNKRLDGFHDSELDELKFYVLSPAPIYLDMEEANLVGMLQMSQAELGESDPFITNILNGKSIELTIKELIQNTKLTDLEYRKNLWDGGINAISNSTDPLIILARKLEPILREDIEWQKCNVESDLIEATEKIASARFAIFGKETYPDATFTLRLSFGVVKGYPMNGTIAPYKTTLFGLYDRSSSFDNLNEFNLPNRFWEYKDKLDLSTPVNFVSTNDIIGGNSGSPVINKNGDLVGIIFDGNIESLPGRFIYDDIKSRAVSVHSAYIIEALKNLYQAQSLVDEIL
jgi:V8-like Glu-specific endopeptidase